MTNPLDVTYTLLVYGFSRPLNVASSETTLSAFMMGLNANEYKKFIVFKLADSSRNILINKDHIAGVTGPNDPYSLDFHGDYSSHG